MQKEKEEAKQRCDTMERDKMRIERQLEDTSAQVHMHAHTHKHTHTYTDQVIPKKKKI